MVEPVRKMEPGLACDGLIAVAAFRYALGRMSYIVNHVGQWLIANAERLPRSDRELICREIDEAERRGNLGMAPDKADWSRVRAALATSSERPER